MASGKVVLTYEPAEYRFIRNELELWQRKMEDHAKTLRAGKEKNALLQRAKQLKLILDSI